jgi:hypothetical protein
MLNFVIVDNDEYFRTGKIIETIEKEYFLVQFDNMNEKGKKMPPELFHISEMIALNGEFKAWGFFATAEQLQEWLDEIDSPRPARIVNLVKN